jgi:hypothetical protein
VLTRQLKNIPTPEDFNNDFAAEYNRRFSLPVWNHILLLVYRFTGPAFPADSPLVAFNDRQAIVRLVSFSLFNLFTTDKSTARGQETLDDLGNQYCQYSIRN